MTLIYLDVETTGLDPKVNSIIQLAGIIKKGHDEERFNFRIRPYRDDYMSKEAEIKTGISNDQAYMYPNQIEAFTAFKELCDKYVTSYNEKMYLIGYNVGFDNEFLREWFEFNNAKWGYMVWFPYIDVMSLASLRMIGKRPYMKNFKLTTVYETIFGHPFEDAHDAMADILATKEIFEKLTMDLMLKPKPFIVNNDGDIENEIPF